MILRRKIGKLVFFFFHKTGKGVSHYWGRTMSSGHRSCADRSGDPSRVGAGEISTGMAPRERRGGHACKIAK